MSNIQRLAQDENKNYKLFAATIINLMHSQGFYGRLYKAVNVLNDFSDKDLCKQLSEQNFNDSLDVVFWLEC